MLGPLAGGLIIRHLSWSWIFWINLPIGLVAAVGFMQFLHERVASGRRSVDAAGAVLFMVAVASLMVALTQIGTTNHATALVSAGVCLASCVLFVFQERFASDPMLALRVWAHRPIATANGATLLSGMALIGLTSFLPMYVQGVLNRSALVAGFALTMVVLGWPIGATVASRIFHRVGVRTTLLFGAGLLPIGALAFLALSPTTSPVIAGLGSIVMGLGMGFLSTSAIVIVQDSVGWSERGVATASNIFSRNLGSTLGATVLGAVLNFSLSMGGPSGPVDADQIRLLLDHSAGSVSDAVVQAALDLSLHYTFWGVFLISVLTLLFATLVPVVTINPRPQDLPRK